MNVTSVKTVAELMSTDPTAIRPAAGVHEAIALLARQKVCAVPVQDQGGTVVGIVSERDCLDAYLRREYYESPGLLVEEIMTTDVVSVRPSTSILQVAEIFSQRRFHHLPVPQGDRLVGQISRKDVIRAIQGMYHTG